MGAACTRGAEPTLEELPLRLQVERVLQAGRDREYSAPSSSGGPAPVRLNLYDLGESGIRRALMMLRPDAAAGAFHCGVEVHGCEWGYGKAPLQWGFGWTIGGKPHPTGITCSVPRECHDHSFCESVPLGRTMVSEDEVLTFMQKIGRDWLATDFNPVAHGSIQFCDTLCLMLGVGRVPERVRSIAGLNQGGAAKGITCCRHVLCNCEHGGVGPEGMEEDLVSLQHQLEQATLKLRQAQRDLAAERASHDDAIRQMLQLKRAVQLRTHEPL